jgi:3-hydroxy-9,10-secoandrosta-1,3,5(10)-triene-9,17-dione monooxygenase reductase component
MPVDPTDFRRALGQFVTGVTVVTTRDPAGRPLGLTANAFCSVSLNPPQVLVCVGSYSETHAGFRDFGFFGVSILSEDQEDISRCFARTGDDKFGTVALVPGQHGVLLVPGAVAHIECRVAAAYPGGDHTIYLGDVVGLAVFPGRPLLYHEGAYGLPENGAGGSS